MLRTLARFSIATLIFTLVYLSFTGYHAEPGRVAWQPQNSAKQEPPVHLHLATQDEAEPARPEQATITSISSSSIDTTVTSIFAQSKSPSSFTAHDGVPTSSTGWASAASFPSFNHSPPGPSSTPHVPTWTNSTALNFNASIPEKAIVMAHLSHEDVSWVHTELADWAPMIYSADNASAPLALPRNKGREAHAYLYYLTTHYDRLPALVAFVHAHRAGYPEAWHNDNPGYSNVATLRHLRLDVVRRNGYVNLRCNGDVGCPVELEPRRDPPDPGRAAERAYAGAWRAMGLAGPVPAQVGAACCSQFAVSREQVRRRPRADYERYYRWLMETELDDATSGRVMEYLWHIIFGKDPIL